jgi:hypothetical protein
LTDAQPLNFIDALGQSQIGFVGEGGRHNSLHARLTRGIRQQPRIGAVPSDDSESVRCIHNVRLTTFRQRARNKEMLQRSGLASDRGLNR